MIKLPLIG